MLSDETFPIDLISDEEDVYGDEIANFPKFHSNNEINSLSSDNHNSSTETEQSMANSMETDRLLSTQSIKLSDDETDKEITHPEASYASETSQNVNIALPQAPIKKKKSFSCHNLNMKKSVGHNYDHIESKVKKLIENLAEDRRKTLLRHKSMPVCVTQAPVIDEKKNDLEKDESDVKRELRRKSIKIYELEEKCEMKDSQIYELEREKSRMRMVFDKLRVEMQELKEMEKQYNKLKAQYSPFKHYRNAIIQTDNDSGFDSEYSKIVTRQSVVITHHHNEHNHVLLNPRQLAFENSELDQTHITEINNTSLDELLPEIDLSAETHDIDGKLISNENEIPNIKPKNLNKKKKKLRFFRFVPCVSFQK
ncbi:putative leucine-rich repeat-containing protein DDB_G0290503 [Chironomus tepperi]|uniref:putative leucine-rich repeat-containing protein DDB_G0290503 n=1 Tax=Chironomus tepperi TaxID=113505 RepID=UPI00391F3124